MCVIWLTHWPLGDFNEILHNFKLVLVLDDWIISCAILLMWMSLGFTDDKSTLIQIMAWCRQAPCDYLNQYWPRSKPSYGLTRPQWVKKLIAICALIMYYQNIFHCIPTLQIFAQLAIFMGSISQVCESGRICVCFLITKTWCTISGTWEGYKTFLQTKQYEGKYVWELRNYMMKMYIM